MAMLNNQRVISGYEHLFPLNFLSLLVPFSWQFFHRASLCLIIFCQNDLSLLTSLPLMPLSLLISFSWHLFLWEVFLLTSLDFYVFLWDLFCHLFLLTSLSTFFPVISHSWHLFAFKPLPLFISVSSSRLIETSFSWQHFPFALLSSANSAKEQISPREIAARLTTDDICLVDYPYVKLQKCPNSILSYP